MVPSSVPMMYMWSACGFTHMAVPEPAGEYKEQEEAEEEKKGGRMRRLGEGKYIYTSRGLI